MALENEGFIELYDLSTKTVVSKVPLAHLKFIPRVGERVLISPTGAGDWRSYKVLDVEYFLNYDPVKNVPKLPSDAGKITLYVEAAKKSSN
jgi:hypothetical protein